MTDCSVCRFHAFFAAQDNFPTSQLLYVSSRGITATKETIGTGLKVKGAVDDGSSEDDANPEDG